VRRLKMLWSGTQFARYSGMANEENTYVRLLQKLNNEDVAEVGGKNASLGEMIGSLSERGIQVPGGFATTAKAYRAFIAENELEQSIRDLLKQVRRDGVEKVGPKIRKAIIQGKWPAEVEAAIRKAYREFSEEQGAEASVAVRSSATAEDLPEASFAGQQDTYLNVSGEDGVLEACKKCYASLFTDRAISYREEKSFDHMAVALSAGVQLMVRGDTGASGVMFTLDTDSGFRDVVMINGAWGLGETVVGGEVNPDEYVVFKPKLDEADCLPIVRRSLGEKAIKAVYSKKKDRQIENKETLKKDRKHFVLSDEEAVRLAAWGNVIEAHYEKPMDIEWAKDGETDELYILQARPETVESQKDRSVLTTYSLESTGKELVSGIAIGRAAATGKVRKLTSPDQGGKFKDGDVLVTEMTDPDWGPIMKRAAAIVTNKGGRTAHAAIVSRELGIPAIVGAGEATEVLSDGQEVTIDCTRGSEGYIYEGELPIEKTTVKLDDMPETKTEIMMNLASPEAAFRWASLPTRGIGLARIEFIINNAIQAHPLALLDPDKVEDKEARAKIRDLLEGWQDGSEFFIRQLSEGIATIAASQYQIGRAHV
jgi:pyruvate, water dikinase